MTPSQTEKESQVRGSFCRSLLWGETPHGGFMASESSKKPKSPPIEGIQSDEVIPSREQQWREIVTNPPESLPPRHLIPETTVPESTAPESTAPEWAPLEKPEETSNSAHTDSLFEFEGTPQELTLRRGIAILLLTATFLILWQEVVGDTGLNSGSPINSSRIQQVLEH